MSEYLQDIFYDTSKLTKNQFRNLMLEAQTLSFNWWVDRKLETSFSREQIDWPFKKAIKFFDRTTRKNLHLTIIHRRWLGKDKHHLEIGFCTLDSRNKANGDIFLWIQVSLEHKDYLIEKYKLQEKL